MDINRLFGKPKTYKIAGIEMTFRPLELENINVMLDMEDKNKRGEAIQRLISLTIRKSYPEIKEEDIKKISLEYLEELTKAILDVHNLNVPE